jgi:hypothetical protein
MNVTEADYIRALNNAQLRILSEMKNADRGFALSPESKALCKEGFILSTLAKHFDKFTTKDFE